MAGTFGYELDLGKLSEAEKDEIRQQVSEYRKYASLIQTGLYYRLSNPFMEEVGAWAFVSEDRSEVLANAVMLEIHGNMTVNYLKLRGLKPEAMYQEQETGRIYSGAVLMEVGIALPIVVGEYHAYQMYFQEV